MRCERCGTEMPENGICPNCGAEDVSDGHVQVLTRAERNAYTGITIEEGVSEEDAGPDIRFERKRGNIGGFSYMTTGGSWQGKLTLILGAAALLLFVFFIALPVALVVIVLSILSWLIYRFLY